MTFMQYESKILPKYKIIGRVNNNLSENIGFLFYFKF